MKDFAFPWTVGSLVFLFALWAAGSALGQEPVNLGPLVNSPDSDFGPIVTADGNWLYYTSDREGGLGNQDVWASRRVDGQWTEPVNLGAPINTKYHEGPDSISVDLKTMYFTRCDQLEQPGICDIFTARRESPDKPWADVERMGPEINSIYKDSNASVSHDGKSLYFVSDRPREGTEKKDFDIFASYFEDGKWGPAQRLEEPVNTPDDELHVMMHQDGKTLYFSSNGHGGLGGFDVFYSILADGKFSEPVNMGKIINTPMADIYFTIPASGDLAYLASNRSGGYGLEDIYSVAIPLELSNQAMHSVKGQVVDKKSCKPRDLDQGDLTTCMPLSGAVILVREKGKSEIVTRVESGPKGEYQLSLPAGVDYTFSAEAKGCADAHIDLILTGDKAGTVSIFNVPLDCGE